MEFIPEQAPTQYILDAISSREVQYLTDRPDDRVNRRIYGLRRAKNRMRCRFTTSKRRVVLEIIEPEDHG